MSFYLDDSDDEAFSTGEVLSSTKNKEAKSDVATAEQHGFICDNCGGTESYLDDTSGGLVCVDCFTQSQTMIAASQELIDYDESMALAGRVSGHLRSTTSTTTRNRSSRKRKRLAELDQSTRLPDVEECILGMQRILKEATDIVAKKLIGKKGVRSVAMETTRTVWKAYMCSWMEGADYYGAIYPEVRFCFRDLFLSTFLRMKILRVLTHEASKKIRAEIGNEQRYVVETNKSMATSKEGFSPPDVEFVQRGNPSDDRVDGDDDDGMSRSVYSVTQTSKIQQSQAMSEDRGGMMNPIGRMILRHQKLAGKKTLGRKAVALCLSPSLPMVAAILCMAFAPFGITCANIQVWIEDGSLPLLNAFPLLTPQEQKRLKRIKRFFHLNEPPSASQLGKLVTNIQIACGYEPKTFLLRKKGSEKEEISQPIKAQKNQHLGRLLTPRSLPLALARIVSQLGLSQKVLDYSLTLMGLPIASSQPSNKGNKLDNENPPQLPKPLRACRSDQIWGMPELLGVVVTASKFIGQWENHWYVLLSTPPAKTSGTASNNAEPTTRFVPWNESLSRHLGSVTKEHLEVLEDNLINVEDSIFLNDEQDFPSDMQPVLIHKKDKTRKASTVLPCLKLLRARQFHHEKSDPQEHIGVPCEANSSVKGMVPPRPFGTLVEYVSVKTGTKPGEVLRFCQKLEEECVQFLKVDFR